MFRSQERGTEKWQVLAALLLPPGCASVRKTATATVHSLTCPASLLLFLGAVPPTGMIIKTKDFSDCTPVVDSTNSPLGIIYFGNVYSEKVTYVLETTDSNKTDLNQSNNPFSLLCSLFCSILLFSFNFLIFFPLWLWLILEPCTADSRQVWFFLGSEDVTLVHSLPPPLLGIACLEC